MALASFNFLASAIDGYQSRPGNPETVLLEANAQIAAEVIEQVAEVPPALFAYFGTSFLGLPPYDGIPAQASITLTFNETVPPTTIPTGWLVSGTNPNGDSVLFGTIADIDAPLGGGDVSVTVEATEVGEAGNGVYGPVEAIEVLEDLG